MKKKNIRAVVVVGGITLIGYFLLIEAVLLMYTQFPMSTQFRALPTPTDETSVTGMLAYLTFLHGVVPGFVVGSIIGAAALLLLPRGSVSLLMLPSVIIFIGNLAFQQISSFSDLIQKDWSWFFSSFLPLWTAFFIGTAFVVVIGTKLRVSNKRNKAIDTDPPQPSAPVRSE